MQSSSPLRVEIKDYPYDPRQNQPVVESKMSPDGRQLYHVYIRLEGVDLALVKAVYYSFDSSVSPRELSVVKSYDNPNFQCDLWLWGVFRMAATVLDVRGGEVQLSHVLEFGSYFEPEKFKARGLSVKRLA